MGDNFSLSQDIFQWLRLREAVRSILEAQQCALDGNDPAPVLAMVEDVRHEIWSEWLRRKMERSKENQA